MQPAVPKGAPCQISWEEPVPAWTDRGGSDRGGSDFGGSLCTVTVTLITVF